MRTQTRRSLARKVEVFFYAWNMPPACSGRHDDSCFPAVNPGNANTKNPCFIVCVGADDYIGPSVKSLDFNDISGENDTFAKGPMWSSAPTRDLIYYIPVTVPRTAATA